MHSINRAAIVVRPKTPFFDWARTLEGGIPGSGEPWSSVYLVSVDEEDTHDEILRRHFECLFEEQLYAWHLNDDDWPTPRTFSMFQKWFDAEVDDSVLDLSEEPIEHDD